LCFFCSESFNMAPAHKESKCVCLGKQHQPGRLASRPGAPQGQVSSAHPRPDYTALPPRAHADGLILLLWDYSRQWAPQCACM
jgi:hypothetical protein